MKIHEIGLGLMLLAAGTCAGQSTQDAPGGSTANSAKPTASAQDATNPTAEKKKPKKVWTNDEIGSAKGTISVVGDPNTSSASQSQRKSEGAPSSGDDAARNQQIENYRQEIQQIRAQIEAIDKRITQLKGFKAENTSPSGGISINQGYNMVPLEDQVKQLEDKKKQLAAKIDNIERDAEKKGIDSGDLR